jgi:hypothetical protein
MGLLRELGDEQAYLKAGIYGFASSGKTWTASLFAVGLAEMIGAKKIGFFETENGSDYVRKPLFEPAGITVMVAKSRAFADVLTFLQECQATGLQIAIIDSISHVWNELMAAYKQKKGINRLDFPHFADIKAEWAKFSEAFIGAKLHLVACGRAGYEWDFFEEEQDGGKTKKVLEKVGVKMKAEGEFTYEPSVVIRMEREKEFDQEANVQTVRRLAHIEKDRFGVIDGKVFVNPCFKDILPHVELLNLGGEQIGPDASRTSLGLITDRDKSAEERKRRYKLALDEILSTITKYFPGRTAPEQSTKVLVSEHVFGVKSWTAIEQLPLETLELVLKMGADGRPSTMESACMDFKAKMTETK